MNDRNLEFVAYHAEFGHTQLTIWSECLLQNLHSIADAENSIDLRKHIWNGQVKNYICISAILNA